MNQHERRAANARVRTFADLAASYPEIPADSLGSVKGVVHMVCRHEEWCRTLTGGGGLLSCNCSPEVSYHKQPTEH